MTFYTADSDRYGPLPMFPTLYSPSEDRVERAVERLVDCADALFMAGRASQVQYDAWMKALDRWASDYTDAARFTRFGR